MPRARRSFMPGLIRAFWGMENAGYFIAQSFDFLPEQTFLLFGTE
jgi:hypothetical protein